MSYHISYHPVLANLLRHPGDVADFDSYRCHLPEKWCPMVTVIGSVISCSDNSPESAESRRFTLESSVYDASKTAPAQFSVDCFFQSTKRWLKVKTPPPGTFLSVVAKVAGRTATNNHLALRVLDLTYLPRPASAAAPTTPVTTPASKRSGRWEGRTAPATPSKKQCLETTAPLAEGATPLDLTKEGQASLSATTSPGTVICLEGGPTASAPGAETRPHRNRRPPGKYTDADG